MQVGCCFFMNSYLETSRQPPYLPPQPAVSSSSSPADSSACSSPSAHLFPDVFQLLSLSLLLQLPANDKEHSKHLILEGKRPLDRKFGNLSVYENQLLVAMECI